MFIKASLHASKRNETRPIFSMTLINRRAIDRSRASKPPSELPPFQRVSLPNLPYLPSLPPPPAKSQPQHVQQPTRPLSPLEARSSTKSELIRAHNRGHNRHSGESDPEHSFEDQSSSQNIESECETRSPRCGSATIKDLARHSFLQSLIIIIIYYLPAASYSISSPDGEETPPSDKRLSSRPS
jgi:hypothetical protein